jgi:hypothetical protein
VPTPSQVANRAQSREPDHHYRGTVTAAGPPVTVALDPDGSPTTAIALDGAAYAVNQRVLVLITRAGNYVLGKIA